MKHRRWAIAILWDGVAVTAITMVLIINEVIPPFIVTTWGLLGAGAWIVGCTLVAWLVDRRGGLNLWDNEPKETFKREMDPNKR